MSKEEFEYYKKDNESLSEHNYYYLLSIIADIRKESGLGDKPMLSELPKLLTQRRSKINDEL